MAAFCMLVNHPSRTAMEVKSQAPALAPSTGQVVTLDDALGVRIQARAGTVWVTEESDPNDHVVGPGEVLVVARQGRTVIQALQPSWIALHPREPANDAFQE